MLDQILKFIGSFVAFGGITWFISYNLGTIINDGIYHFYFDKKKFTPEEFETQKEYERANKWKFRFFTLLIYFSVIFSVVTVLEG